MFRLICSILCCGLLMFASFASEVLPPAEAKIDAIEAFLINVNFERHFSFGVWKNRQHLILRVVSGENSGWGECITAKNNLDYKPETFLKDFKSLKGMTLTQALAFLEENKARIYVGNMETMQTAILDVLAQTQEKPAVELLDLKENKPVNGMYCILEETPEAAKKQAELAMSLNLKNFIKLKIFGDLPKDISLVKAIRETMGAETYIVADANEGYKNFASIAELAATINQLADAGLNALEDPAKLTNPEWVELQKLTPLALIPDVPLRPSWTAKDTLIEGMGKFYNLHPCSMGDMLVMSKNLIPLIYSWGAQIMVGDNSLVGPGCAIFQQIAIACGAAWVEATEKPAENKIFTECILQSPISRSADGLYMIAKPQDVRGFGLQVDIEKLRKTCDRYASVE